MPKKQSNPVLQPITTPRCLISSSCDHLSGSLEAMGLKGNAPLHVALVFSIVCMSLLTRPSASETSPLDLLVQYAPEAAVLQGYDAQAQPHLACLLLEHGNLVVLGTNYDNAFECHAPVKTSSMFGSQAGWDACHSTLATLMMNPSRSDLAIEKYNSNMTALGQKEFMCDDQGAVFRTRIVLATVLGTTAVFAVVGIIALLLKLTGILACIYSACWQLYLRCFESLHLRANPAKVWAQAWAGVGFVLYLLLRAYDYVSDAWTLYVLGRSGSRYALICVGWVMLAPFAAAVVVIAYLMLPGIHESLNPLYMPFGGLYYWKWSQGICMCLLWSLVCFAAGILGVVLAAFATSNLVTYTYLTTVSVNDAKYLAMIFIIFSTACEFLVGFDGVLHKFKFTEIRADIYRGAPVHLASFRRIMGWLVVRSDLMPVLIESAPQLVVQALMWAWGYSGLPVRWFVISSVSSTAGVLVGVVMAVAHLWMYATNREEAQARRDMWASSSLERDTLPRWESGPSRVEGRGGGA